MPNTNDAGSINYYEFELQSYLSKLILESGDIVNGKSKVLVLFVVVIVVAFLLKNLFRYFAMFFLAPLRNGVVRDLRAQMVAKSLKLPLSFFSNEKKGDMISRMTYDVQEVEWSILSSLEAIFREPLSLVIILGLLFFMDWHLEFTNRKRNIHSTIKKQQHEQNRF